MFDIQKIRDDFPILHRKVYDKDLIYFDNAATTQKPQSVIDAVTEVYEFQNSNIHRGVHYLSEQLTDSFEKARKTTREFINAKSEKEIIFTAGTTASINLLAFSFGEKIIKTGDEILITALEHHANIVPWQMLCERKGAVLKVAPVNDKGELLFEEYQKLLSEKTRLVGVTHISNALGIINDVKAIIDEAHERDIPVLIDGAQSVQHTHVDVQALNCEFFVFSGHKLYGPTGIGVLYGKEEWLEKLPPYQTGGEMIHKVTFEKTTFNELPFKFEAGTPNYTGAIGMAEAINYVSELGIEDIAACEHQLLEYGTKRMQEIDGLQIIGTAEKKASVISFVMEGVHHYDAGMILDKLGIAVRTGHHCAEPVMTRFGIEGTIRASFAFYNTKEEIDTLIDGLQRVKTMLG